MEGEEDALDENDSDESTPPIARRRREASDEDYDGIECEDSAKFRKTDHGSRFGSGSESDGLGKAQRYVDAESYTEEEGVDEVDVVELPESDAGRTGLHGDHKRNEEKMNVEPFRVPNFGSFYFHDDRSNDRGGRDRGQRRRVLSGGSRLWVTNDEQKWGHDKFEEMMQQERQHQESNVRRISTGCSQDNKKNEDHRSGNVKGTRNRPHEKSGNQNRSSKVVRGRGPVRYKPLTSSKKVIPSTKNKESGQSLETTSTTVKGVLLHTSNLHSVPHASMKCVSASSSSSALLYPDGSTSHHSVTQKKDAKPGGTSRCHLMSVLQGKNFATSKPGVLQPGSTVVHPADPNRFHFKSVHPVGEQCLTNWPSLSSVSLSAYMGGSLLSLDQGQHPSVQPRLLQGTVRSSLLCPVQKLSQHPESVSQTPSIAFTVNPSEPGALASLPGGKSKHASDGKGSGIVQRNERGDLYERGSQNFPATPANFPVLQFYDQHLESPRDCTCFTFYASLSTHGFGNSEMARKEIGTNMASDGRVSIDEPELMNHKAWQQKSKPRRYSQMNFEKQIE